VALIAGPILSLIAFVVSYYVNPLNFSGQSPVAAIPAFLLAIVILLVSHNLAAFRELERASSDSDRIYEAVKDYLHVTKVGSTAVAWQYVIARLPILQDVRNTSFNINEEAERSEERLYELPAYTNAARQIVQWTDRQLRWKDIGDASAIKRFRKIAEAVNASGKAARHYQYKLIAHNEPQINFILLTYIDGGSEVLFNWDFRSIGQDPIVLLSRDRDIVEMFAVQFEYLWRAASPDHDNTAVRSTSRK
jgi:hypothetical protein